MNEEQLYSGVQKIYRRGGRPPKERTVRALLKTGIVLLRITTAIKRFVNWTVTFVLFPFQFVGVLILFPMFLFKLRKKTDRAISTNDASVN
jgi:hypothetical protein